MRKLYLCLGVALLTGTALCHADNTSKLIVTAKNGFSKEFDLKKIGKVTFNDNNMVMLMTDNSKETLSLMDIQKITFDVQILGTGIEMVETVAGEDLHIALENNVMTLTERNGKEIEVTVFSTNGVQILNSKGPGALQIDFGGLNPGIYIIKANDKTIKYIK